MGPRRGEQGYRIVAKVGILILLLGLTRLVWRRVTPLPPWAEHLSATERTVEGRLEKGLLALLLLLLVPGSGLLLALGGGRLLPPHVVSWPLRWLIGRRCCVGSTT